MASKKTTITRPDDYDDELNIWLEKNAQDKSKHYRAASLFYRAAMDRKRKVEKSTWDSKAKLVLEELWRKNI